MDTPEPIIVPAVLEHQPEGFIVEQDLIHDDGHRERWHPSILERTEADARERVRKDQLTNPEEAQFVIVPLYRKLVTAPSVETGNPVPTEGHTP